MSVLRRADTWEISESDASAEELTVDPRSHHPATLGEEQVETLISEAKESSSQKESAVPGRTLSPPAAINAPTPSPARKRRSREQRDADRRKTEERREARARQRAARAQKKEERRQEQQKRKEAGEILKQLRPENCIKSFTVCIDPDLLQHVGSDILLDTLASLDWRINIEKQQISHSISWTRDDPQGGEDHVSVEEQAIVVLSSPFFTDLVESVKKMLSCVGEEIRCETTCFSILECLNKNTEKVVTLLVTENGQSSTTDCLAEGQKSKSRRRYLDMEEVLVYLQLYKNVSLFFVDDWQDVTDHVCAVTKALSKRPYKLLTERSDLPFCVDGTWASGAKVDKDGSGLAAVWNRQVQQLNRVSPAVAAAVTTAFPSPQLLLQAYKNLDTEQERKKMLAALPVKTEGKERRIGPDVSTRLYRCFSVENPHLVLD